MDNSIGSTANVLMDSDPFDFDHYCSKTLSPPIVRNLFDLKNKLNVNIVSPKKRVNNVKKRKIIVFKKGN